MKKIGGGEKKKSVCLTLILQRASPVLCWEGSDSHLSLLFSTYFHHIYSYMSLVHSFGACLEIYFMFYRFEEIFLNILDA